VHALDKRKKKQTIPLHFASSVSLPEITKIRLRAFAAQRQSCLFVYLFRKRLDSSLPVLHNLGSGF
jgi:hypothetical protein